MPAQISVLPTRNPINPAVDAAFSVPAKGQIPHDGASPPALGGSPAENEDTPFSLWGSDGFTFGDIFDIINPLQHIPIVSTIYRAITGDDIAVAPKVAGGALFGGVIGLVVSIIDTAIEQITGQDAGEHILALLDNVEISSEVLVADEDDGFTAPPVEVGEAAGAFEISEMIIEVDRETSDALIFAAASVTPANGNHAAVAIRRLATSGAAAGQIEPARGRTVVRGAMTAAKAASLDDIGANAKAPPSLPGATTPGPALGKAMPGVAAGGQSPFAGSNRALWLDLITENTSKRKDGDRAGADRGVVQAMGRALDQYNRTSRLGATGPRVKVNF